MLTAALVACNSLVGFDELTVKKSKVSTSSSGGEDDDDEIGGGKNEAGLIDPDTGTSGGPRCNPTAPFGAPVVVPELDGAMATRTAVMTPDELDIYYLRGANTPFQLRHAKRASRSDKWSEPVSENLSPDATYLMALTVGGTKLYYWRTGANSSETKNYSAPRSTSFGPGAFFFTTSTTNRSVFVTQNDDTAYWSDYFQADGGPLDKVIFRGNVNASGVISPSQVSGIHNVNGLDENPVVNGKETVMYFASSRPGGPGGMDIHVSTRESKDKAWLAPRIVSELNSPSPEVPTWASEDDCVILLDRLGHSMVAVRPP